MEHPFGEWLIRTTWQASGLCVIVLAAQWFFGKRLSAAWRCNLWLLVACRFVLPFSWESPFSVFNLTGRPPIPLAPMLIGAVDREAPVPSRSLPPTLPATASKAGAGEQAVNPATERPQQESSAARRVAGWPARLCALWLAGAATMLVWMTASAAWFQRRLRAAIEIQNPEVTGLLAQCTMEMRVRRRVRVFETAAVTSPALWGFWKPRILLPPGKTQSLTPAQLRFVFLHELGHVKRWDTATGWLVMVAQALHWFNPLARLVSRRLQSERELACDALVLQRAGADQRKPYGETILRLLQEIGRPAFVPGMLGVVHDVNRLRRRMKLIANFTPAPTAAVWPAILFAVIGAAGLTDSLPVRAANPDSPAESPGWRTLAPADPLSGRGGSSVIWTGTEMIVFGGEGMNVSFGDGARFDLAANTWQPLPAEGAPSSRTQHSAVWTGKEMIVWGGFGGSSGNDTIHNDGARFDPRQNLWRPVSSTHAPSPRFQHSAVWTGREMLIWGGYTDSHALYQGAYADAYLNSGGAYNPVADAWRPISTLGAPSPRFGNAAVWTGSRLIIWGGNDATQALNDGGIYDPATDTWTPINTDGAPSPRKQPAAVWTGTELIVWGGDSRDDRVFFQDGARYNPLTGRWAPLSTNAAPVARNFVNAVWTGSEMVFWGGINDAIGHTSYLPALVVTPTESAGTNFPPRTGGDVQSGVYLQGGQGGIQTSRPVQRLVIQSTAQGTSVWAETNSSPGTGPILRGGQSVVVNPPGTIVAVSSGQLDGSNPSRYLNTGAAYDPATDSWTPLSRVNGPSARLTSAVWTGRGLLIFGGFNGTHLNDVYYLLP